MTNEHNGLMRASMTQKRRFSCRKTPSDYCVSWRWHWRWATLNGSVVQLWTASLCTAPAYWYHCAVERFTLPCLCLRSLFHKKMKNRGRPEKNLDSSKLQICAWKPQNLRQTGEMWFHFLDFFLSFISSESSNHQPGAVNNVKRLKVAVHCSGRLTSRGVAHGSRCE